MLFFQNRLEVIDTRIDRDTDDVPSDSQSGNNSRMTKAWVKSCYEYDEKSHILLVTYGAAKRSQSKTVAMNLRWMAKSKM